MNPIKELETLRTETHEWTDVLVQAGENPLSEIKGDLFDLEVEFEPAAGAETVFDMRGIKVVYSSRTQTLSCGSLRSRLPLVDGVIRLRILLDRTSIEVYGNDGRVYIPSVVFPKEDDPPLRGTCVQGEVKVNYLRVHELKSSWE